MGYIQLQLYSLKDGSIVCVLCAIARGNNTLSFVTFYKETTKTIDVEKGARLRYGAVEGTLICVIVLTTEGSWDHFKCLAS